MNSKINSLPKSSEHPTLGVVLAAVASIGFGLLGFFAKQLFAANIGIGHVLMLRFWVATVLIWVFIAISCRRELRGLTWRQIGLCILLGVVGYAGQAALYFTALRELKSGLASILLYLYPAWVAFLITLTTRKSPNKVQLLAMALAFMGCLLVVDLGDATLSSLGIAAGIGAAVWYASYLVVSEIVLRNVKPEIASGLIFLGAASILSVYAIIWEPNAWPVTTTSWSYLIAMAVVATVLPVVTLFMAIQYIGAIRTSIICTLEPVVTIVAGYFLMNETLSLKQLAGIGLILFTLLLLRLRDIH